MKLAFFSPLNPVQSGISDYSEELLATLWDARVGGRPVNIDLFVDGSYKPANEQITKRFKVLPERSFDRVAGDYDTAIYQMGNSPAHAYIYDELHRHPGVVVMHEFVLHHLRIWMALNGGKRAEYISTMERLHGHEGIEAANRVLLGQFPEALFDYPLSEDVIEKARGIIVHSRYMAGLVQGVRPDVPVSVVPMGVPLPPLISKEAARARLGIDPDLFLITSVGHLNPYKRVATTLQAFKALLRQVPGSLYLLVGSRSPNYDPGRDIEMLHLSNKVKITGYVPSQELPYYLAASDVCLNLRHPTAGETSASLLRIMGAGVPVIVSRTGSFEELPDDAVGKVDIDDLEKELLIEYLALLARRPDLRAAMSAEARRYVASYHTLEGAARGYLDFLSSLERDRGSAPVAQEMIALSTSGGEIISAFALEQPATKAEPSPEQAVIAPEVARTPGYDPIALVSDALVEMGVDEENAFLEEIAQTLEGLVPLDEPGVADQHLASVIQNDRASTPSPLAYWRLLHPLPSLMTVLAAGAFILLAARGLPPVGLLLYLLLIETARQFSISALNDYFDRNADAGRSDKPVASGAISPGIALSLGAALAVLALALSFPMGLWFTILTAVGLGGGLLYDAGLKYTLLSWLPFSIAFPTLPLWAWAGVYSGGAFPPRLLWVLPVGVVMVLGIHLADTVPDLEADKLAGVQGLAHRLGLRKSLALCWGAFASSTLMTLLLWPLLSYRAEWYLPGLVLGVGIMSTGVATYLANRGRVKVMALLLEAGALVLAVGWIAALTL